MRAGLAVFLGLLLCASNGLGQSTPAAASPVVADVLRLSHAKVEENIIIAFIQSSAGAPLTASDILDLRAQGLSSGILIALMNAQPGSPAALPPTSTPATAQSEPGPVAPVQTELVAAAPYTSDSMVLAAPEPVYYDFSAPYYPYSYDPYYGDLYFGVGLGWGLGWGFTGCWGWGGSGWGGYGWGGYPYCGSWYGYGRHGYGYGYHGNGNYGYGNGYHGNGNNYHGNGYQNGPAGGHYPEHPIRVHTQVGIPGQAEGLREVNQAELHSQAAAVGPWPQQDIQADQPPLGGANLGRRRRDMLPWEQQLE